MRWNALFLVLLLAAATTAITAPAQEVVDEANWPKEIKRPKALITIYEPQIEKLTENDVQARAAVSVTLTGETEPHFGAVWLTGRLEVDRDERIVYFRDVKVPDVRFAEATDEQKRSLAGILESEIPTWDLQELLDNLIPLLELADHEEVRDTGFRHDPPDILFATVPTALVYIDGEPRRQPVTMPETAVKKKIERVVNTPNLIAWYPKNKWYYLSGGGDIWYRSKEVLGPYEPARRVPKSVKEMLTEEEKNVDEEGDPPVVLVVTTPTELIVTDGAPEYAPVAGLDLLNVSNTESIILVDMESQRHFVLLSGRWYQSERSLAGPWSFTDPGQLPEDFAKIPADSELSDVLAHVPGTDQAREAMMDNLIPQTAAIDRNDTSLTVEYDGQPKFESVEGAATVQYAVNSPQSVFKVGNLYYSCNQGVWYVSGSPTGPWTVATEVPSVIYDIPPSNPHHNVTYVRVYDVTPTVVYTGYTPGYMGSYYYHGCVIWGTGWHYRPWWGRYYYPRPYTWGFHASFSPWYGWGFGVSWGRGPFRMTVGRSSWRHHHYRHGWWGPGGWRRPYYPPYRPPHHRPPHGGTRPPTARPPVARPPATKPGSPGGAQPGTLPAAAPRNNIYAKNQNAGRLAKQPATTPGTRPGTAVGKPNNVVADPRGNVYRSNPSGSWDKRQGGSWQPSSPPSGSKTSRQPAARSRGQSRSVSTPPRSAPRSAPSRPSAPRSSGGGRKK